MNGPTDGASGSALIGLLVVIVVEVTHRLLPPGTHFRFMDRFLRKNDEVEVEEKES